MVRLYGNCKLEKEATHQHESLALEAPLIVVAPFTIPEEVMQLSFSINGGRATSDLR
jgi:hypothetical protein